MRTSFRTFKKRVLDEKKENHNQCEDRKEDMPKEESKKITNSILPVYEGVRWRHNFSNLKGLAIHIRNARSKGMKRRKRKRKRRRIISSEWPKICRIWMRV